MTATATAWGSQSVPAIAKKARLATITNSERHPPQPTQLKPPASGLRSLMASADPKPVGLAPDDDRRMRAREARADRAGELEAAGQIREVYNDREGDHSNAPTDA